MSESTLTVEQGLALARQYHAAENYYEAIRCCQKIFMVAPELSGAKELMAELAAHNASLAAQAQSRLPGIVYLDWLYWFHETIKPATYVEIGVEHGRSMQFAKPPTRAIGIDPRIEIRWPLQENVTLFEMTSDQFFVTQDLRATLQREFVDFAFLDGLHTFDQTLRDFINIERFAHSRTVVLLHDVMPVVPITAERHRKTEFWLGDTWKIIPILREQRPDLHILTIPSYPSGLAIVTGLDPTSTRLNDAFNDTVLRYLSVPLAPNMPQLDGLLNVVPNDPSVVANWLKERFGS